MRASGKDLPRGWHAETPTHADRTHVLRLGVKEVRGDQKRVRGKVWFQSNWQTGARSEHEIIRHAVSDREHSDGERIQERVRQRHAERQTDRQMAAVVHAEGYRTTYGQPFQAKHLWDLRRQWGFATMQEDGLQPDRLRWEDGTSTIQGVVQAIGVPKDTGHIWCKQGRLTGTHLGPYMPWRIRRTAEQMHT